MVRESSDESSGAYGEHSSPDPLRRNRHSHAAILDAALGQLRSVGYQRMTIEGVAAQAGVGKATVYRWWSSKAQLVVEALSTSCDVAPVVATGDLRVDVRALVQYVVSLVTRTPLGQILPQLVVDLEDDAEARANLAEWLGPPRAGHRALLYSAASRSDLPHDIDAALVLDLLGGTILWRTLLGRKPDSHLVEQLTNLIVDRDLPRTGVADDSRPVI
jgi:AcrR family transcriptional regulator